MRYAGKWNYGTKEYDLHELPEGSTIYSADMDMKCSCANCGKQIRYGNSFTSLEIHDIHGFGYVVCPECHDQEIERKLRDKGYEID